MQTQSIESWQHAHVFIGAAYRRNERKTWAVVALASAMMLGEILGGVLFGSVALIADGLHMSTHAGAPLIAALADLLARRYAGDPRLAFGTESGHDDERQSAAADFATALSFPGEPGAGAGMFARE